MRLDVLCGLQPPHLLKPVVHAKNVKRRYVEMTSLCQFMSHSLNELHSGFTISQSDLLVAVVACHNFIQLERHYPSEKNW